MSLFIYQDPPQFAQAQAVYNDLSRICPDPNLKVDSGIRTMQDSMTNKPVTVYGTGGVGFLKPPDIADPKTPVGSKLVWRLVDSSVEIWIRGATTTFSIGGGKNLGDAAGITTPMVTKGSKSYIMIVYDTAGCNLGAGRKGYAVLDTGGNELDMPSDVILFHELTHAFHKVNGTEDTTSKEATELQAAIGENEYRKSKNPPLRERNTTRALSHSGIAKCKLLSPPPGQTPQRTGSCFIATAAYGSQIEDEVEFLRHFRDHLLLSMRSGAQFFERFYQYYYGFSPSIADNMGADPEMAKLVRIALVEPLVRYLWLAMRMPDATIDGVPEPWAFFIIELRDNLDRWTSQLDLPTSFESMPIHDAVRELGIVLRYGLRSPERRNAYLAELERRGSIPLAVSKTERAGATATLEALGRSHEEIERMLGPDGSAMLERSFSGSLAAIGTDHLINLAAVSPQEWFYTVTITNNTHLTPTPMTFEEIVLFYKRKNLPGVVFLVHKKVEPTATVVFTLGVCSEVESYSWGAFGYLSIDGILTYAMVASVPEFNEAGQPMAPPMTPSQRDAEEVREYGRSEPCADSYRIGP